MTDEVSSLLSVSPLQVTPSDANRPSGYQTSTAVLDPVAAQLLDHLHRGGLFGCWWTAPNRRTHWWPVANRAPLPQGRLDMYFGVHPVRQIPPTNSKGQSKPPSAVRSQIAYIAAINCMYAEFDVKDFGGDKLAARAYIGGLPIPPSAIVNSGGGLHCYWLLAEPFLIANDFDRNRAKRAQYAWTKYVGSDGGAKDLARVLRVPGARNYKKKYAPDFPVVEIEQANFESLHEFETLERVAQPAQPSIAKPEVTQRPAIAPAKRVIGYNVVDEVSRAEVALSRLAPWRADEYVSWISVGMSLKVLGADGLRLWESWSRQSSKYKEGECANKWETFR